MRKPKQAAKNPLRKLNKLQLLELLAQQEKELASLRAALAERDEELERRTLMLQESGSIAEAALKLNGVFTKAISLVGTIVLYYMAVKTGVKPHEYYGFSAAYGELMGAFTALAGFVGAQLKLLCQRWLDDKTKEAVARTCVKAVE